MNVNGRESTKDGKVEGRRRKVFSVNVEGQRRKVNRVRVKSRRWKVERVEVKADDRG